MRPIFYLNIQSSYEFLWAPTTGLEPAPLCFSLQARQRDSEDDVVNQANNVGEVYEAVAGQIGVARAFGNRVAEHHVVDHDDDIHDVHGTVAIQIPFHDAGG